MEMDYSLLDSGPEDATGDESVEIPTTLVDTESTTGNSGKEISSGSQRRENNSVDDFDESLPLTPREKILMERLDRIQGENLVLSRPAPVDTGAVLTPSDRNFLDGLDMDEVLATPENLNRLLLSVYNSAMEESSKLSAERILQNLPQIMSTYVTNHMTMAKMAEKFYADNADLASSSQTVAAVANKIAAEHPEYTAEQVFDASAVEARKILRIKAASSSSEQTRSKTRPAFVAPGRGRNGLKAPVLSAIEKGVLDLISD